MIKRFLRNDSGASAVEFAIVSFPLMLIFFSMLAWAYSLTLIDTMYDAARLGAREMSVDESNEAQAIASTQSRLTQWPQSFNVVATNGTDEVTVTVTTANFFSFLDPIIPAIPPLTATVTMRKEDTL